MKTTKSIILSAVAMFFLVSCGDSSSKYFGKVPAIANDYVKKSVELDSKIKEAKFEGNFKQWEKASLQEEKNEMELEKKLHEAGVKSLGKVINAEVSEGLAYEISSPLTIAEHRDGFFEISYSLNTTEDIVLSKTVETSRYTAMNAYTDVYVKYLNKKGDIIFQTDPARFLGELRYEKHGSGWYAEWKEKPGDIILPTGTILDETLNISFSTYSDIEDVEKNKRFAELDKIVFITEEEFNENEKTLPKDYTVRVKRYVW